MTDTADRADVLLAAGPWTCFHCDETFADRRCAALHFGATEDSEAACRIKAGAEGSLLNALREAERSAAVAWDALHSESSDFAKAYHGAMSRHSQSLQAAEEAGYERGLCDTRALATPQPETNDDQR